MVFFKRILLMLQFLTSIPLPVNIRANDEDFGKGLVFAPLIGLVIGSALGLLYYLSVLALPVHVAAVFVVTAYILLTGGLHMDGLGDSFDGLFSNRSRERMLEIMRDSRIGTNGVLAITCVVLLDASLIAGIDAAYAVKALMLFPVAGRIGSLVGSGVSTYARSGEGLGKSFIGYCGYREIIAGLVVYFAIFYFIWGMAGVIISVLPVVTAFITVKFLSRKIGGATGDVLGAVCELNQTFFLIAVLLVKKYFI